MSEEFLSIRKLLPYLREERRLIESFLDDQAVNTWPKSIQKVNCIRVNKGGWVGQNTDLALMAFSLIPSIIDS